MQRRRLYAASLILLGTAAMACELPDEGSAQYRRLVTRVKYLPDIVEHAERLAWAKKPIQYILDLEAPQRVDGRCHWPVEVRAEDQVWRRYLVPYGPGTPIRVPSG